MLKSGQVNQVVLISTLLISTVFFSERAKSYAEDSTLLNDSFENCGLSVKSQLLAKLIIEDSEQQRAELHCNPLLSKVAQQKAEEMATHGEVSHYAIGDPPDQRLAKAGYKVDIPSGAYGLNHVEAVLGGFSEPQDVIDQLRNSFYHRVHLFAEHEFFLEQNEIGVGYAYEWKSPHVDYWVVYIAKRKDDLDKSEPSTKHIEGSL